MSKNANDLGKKTGGSKHGRIGKRQLLPLGGQEDDR
jgi:hypothetical protein